MSDQQEDVGGVQHSVTGRYVVTRESIDREGRAMRSWLMRRASFWARWALAWVVFVGAVLAGVYLLVRWLAPEASGFLSWAVILGGGMMLAAALVDAATLRQRWLRRFLKIVERQTPVGTPVEQTVATDRFVVSTPGSTYAVPTASITRATWIRDCLVVETGAKGFWVINGEGLDDEAMQVMIDTLGDRLRT